MTAETWHIPLGRSYYTIQQALNTMNSFKLDQSDVPFIIRLFENPKYNLLPGAVTLDNHDIIHVLLSRGLLVKDEAFVIGFTMGSTNRLTRLNKAIFKAVTRFLYPPEYKFYKDEIDIFESGVRCAKQMGSPDLSKLDLTCYLNYTIERARKELNIDIKILQKAYAYEKVKYSAPECQRLLTWI